MTRVQHLFIVRIWHELDQEGQATQWRGSIEHVPSGQRLYFTSLRDLCDFISSNLQLPKERIQTNDRTR